MEYRHSFVSEHICSCVRCQEIQASAAVPNPHNPRFIQHIMPAAFTPETFKQANYWRKYRDPKSADYSMIDLTRLYCGVKHTPPAFAPPRTARRLSFPRIPGTVAAKPHVPDDDLIKAFMSKRIASLPIDFRKWKGVRVLGDGASAMAGLWECMSLHAL